MCVTLSIVGKFWKSYRPFPSPPPNQYLDDAVHLPRLCYNYPVIQNYYTSRRQKCERLSRYSISGTFQNILRIAFVRSLPTSEQNSSRYKS